MYVCVYIHTCTKHPGATQGADNSLKHWIFDNADGSARLLRFRAGHSAPPVRVRGYGEEGRRLLSAGEDRAFRMLSIVQDQQSRELRCADWC